MKIAGIGYSVPKTVITNEDLTKLYDTSDEWIYTRTGIKERRVVTGNETAIDLGYDAAVKALSHSGIKAEDIDCIISAASVPPQLYPTLACTLQSKLGITRTIPAFDMTAACSGLIYAMQVARGMIGTGIYKNILIVAAVITPTADMFTLLVVSLPIWLLYEVSIIIVKMTEKPEEEED